MCKSIRNITIVELMAVGGGGVETHGDMLTPSKLNFPLPDTSNNSLLGKPEPYPVGIRGGLKIVPCEINETIGLTNSTMVTK